ncbi:MAG: hypothetical protein BWY86_00477 [Candidatus Aminicenantes bacterium ADurb.Bin508]|nr:MAG: hypothetical protein BWY86_00477 [Candidatus Aminicenantes bacterium ADurb.Bin508]
MMTSSITRTLRRLQRPPSAVETPPPALESTPEEPLPDIREMTLEAFSKARLVVRIRSRLLGTEIILASDNALLDEEAGSVVYRASELKRLLSAPPEAVRDIHRMKDLFRGSRITEMRLET